MPIHDWTRVIAGAFHDFHQVWISELRNVLNGGILPSDYYAQVEQVTRPWEPDVLALQSNQDLPKNGPSAINGEEDGRIAVAERPPQTRFHVAAEADRYAQKSSTVVIHHASGDRIVALNEIVSPGNKSSRPALRSFLKKTVEILDHGYHLLVVDLFPPGTRDPQGLHDLIWAEFDGAPFQRPPGEPLTLVSYSSGSIKEAYVEPTAVGRSLMDMPLFLEPEFYVKVPLEETYMAAYRGVPRRWKAILEA